MTWDGTKNEGTYSLMKFLIAHCIDAHKVVSGRKNMNSGPPLIRECPPFRKSPERTNMDHSSLRFIISVCLMLVCAMAQMPQAQQSRESGKSSSDSTPATPPGLGGTSLPNAYPFPSTYHPFPGRPTLIRKATIMTAAGPSIMNGSGLMSEPAIAALGASISAPADAF